MAADGSTETEAGAWELLKRRVAENRKLSTENRKLKSDLGESRVRQANRTSCPCSAQQRIACRALGLPRRLTCVCVRGVWRSEPPRPTSSR